MEFGFGGLWVWWESLLWRGFVLTPGPLSKGEGRELWVAGRMDFGGVARLGREGLGLGLFGEVYFDLLFLGHGYFFREERDWML